MGGDIYLDGLTADQQAVLGRVNEPGLTALRAHLADGGAVAFLGAGVSAPLYPLWDGLIGELVDAAAGRMSAEEAATCRALARQNPEEIVEIVRQQLGVASYRDVLREILRARTDPETGRSWTPVHELVCRCAFKAVVTTNYDPGILNARMRVRPHAAATGFTTWEDELGLDRWRTGDVFGEAELPYRTPSQPPTQAGKEVRPGAEPDPRQTRNGSWGAHPSGLGLGRGAEDRGHSPEGCLKGASMRNQIASVIGAAVIGLLVAACSSSSSSTTSSPATSSPASSSAAAAPATTQASSPAPSTSTVSLAAISGIPAKALVGANGRTLYLFQADKNGTSACTGACAAAWPPDIVTGTPQAGTGVNQALLGTITRPDGTLQLTYNGHPLYYFTADAGGGTAHGQAVKAFGAEWYVVNASGSKIDTS